MIELAAAATALKAARSPVIAALCSAALCLPLGYCRGSADATARAEAARALANTKALKVDAAAKDHAAAARVKDALQVKENEDALVDAISTVPDEAPDAVRVRLGCQRLRAQGTAAADLPALCRSGG
jgi:hypothetical protein